MSESPERIDTVYRQRAARLAKGRSVHAPAGERLRVLVFRLGAERYAIEAGEVAEAIPLERCAPVPGSLPVFAGVINLRGELRAVVDLARLLALSASSSGDAGFVLVLRQRGQSIGLKVDRIEELRELGRGELSPLADGKYVTGVAPGMLMLLSVDALLEEIFLKEEAR
jgi:chemotaxis signal transduction protein